MVMDAGPGVAGVESVAARGTYANGVTDRTSTQVETEFDLVDVIGRISRRDEHVIEKRLRRRWQSATKEKDREREADMQDDRHR